MQIIIKSENVRKEVTRKGTELIKQQAAFDIGGDYPIPFDLTVNEPYAPGKYHLSPLSFRVSPFGSLELNPFNIQLVRV